MEHHFYLSSVSEQPACFNIWAFVSFIKPDQPMWYRACKTCNKKVTEAIGSGFWCEGCQRNDESCSLRCSYEKCPSLSEVERLLAGLGFMLLIYVQQVYNGDEGNRR